MSRNARILLCVLVLPLCGGDDRCNLDKIKYQANFNEEKYLGLWYEIRWYAGDEYSPADVHMDYTHYYYKKPNDPALYCDKDFRNGRTGKCVKSELKYDPTGTPGKYMYGDRPFFFVKTDYDNYALDLTCWGGNVSGSCVNSFSNVLGRRKTLSAERMRIIEEEIYQLCAPTSYFNITNDNCTIVPSFGLTVLIAIWWMPVE